MSLYSNLWVFKRNKMPLTLLRGPICCNSENGCAFGFYNTGRSRGKIYNSFPAKHIKYYNEAPKAFPESDEVGHFELGELEFKELVQEGINMKDVIKLGRRGVCPSAVEHIKKRWNTSRVAKIHCSGKPSTNMKKLAVDLENETGGIIVSRKGGTILLFNPSFCPGKEDK